MYKRQTLDHLPGGVVSLGKVKRQTADTAVVSKRLSHDGFGNKTNAFPMGEFEVRVRAERDTDRLSTVQVAHGILPPRVHGCTRFLAAQHRFAGEELDINGVAFGSGLERGVVVNIESSCEPTWKHEIVDCWCAGPWLEHMASLFSARFE